MRFFASARSAGRTLPWKGGEIVVEDAATADCQRPRHRPVLRRGRRARASWRPASPPPGAIVIDNSSAWRMDPDVPLVVAEVNPHDAGDRSRRASWPTRTARPWPPCRCSKPLHDEAGLRRLVASTYQAVSGAGLAGVEELDEQVAQGGRRRRRADLRRRRGRVPGAGQVRPADRLQRAAARRQARGRRQRRDRRGAEAPQREPQDPRASRTCWSRARACGCRCSPATRCRSTPSSSARSRRPSATSCSRHAPGVVVTDVPTPLEAAGKDPSYVGRIRQDSSVPDGRGLVLFVSQRQPAQGRRAQRHPDRRSLDRPSALSSLAGPTRRSVVA